MGLFNENFALPTKLIHHPVLSLEALSLTPFYQVTVHVVSAFPILFSRFHCPLVWDSYSVGLFTDFTRFLPESDRLDELVH